MVYVRFSGWIQQRRAHHTLFTRFYCLWSGIVSFRKRTSASFLFHYLLAEDFCLSFPFVFELNLCMYGSTRHVRCVVHPDCIETMPNEEMLRLLLPHPSSLPLPFIRKLLIKLCSCVSASDIYSIICFTHINYEWNTIRFMRNCGDEYYSMTSIPPTPTHRTGTSSARREAKQIKSWENMFAIEMGDQWVLYRTHWAKKMVMAMTIMLKMEMQQQTMLLQLHTHVQQ